MFNEILITFWVKAKSMDLFYSETFKSEILEKIKLKYLLLLNSFI